MDMGEQRKRISRWQFSILSILVVLAFFMSGVGASLVTSRVAGLMSDLTTSSTGEDFDRYWGIDEQRDGKSIGINGSELKKNDQVYEISTAYDLAYMRYVISKAGEGNSAVDYSGCTFILKNDIDLSKVTSANSVDSNGEDKILHPYWTPIDIGDRNTNIVFDGDGKKIIGMRIKCNTSTAKNAGFFASMVGGAVVDVTFVDPVIEYEYTGTSIKSDDENRPTRPTEICVGVVAGEADSTYFNNIQIVNPKVSFMTKNYNAHTYCVGTAVGKLSLTRKDKNSTINTFSPNKWGFDKVVVTTGDAESSVPNTSEDIGLQTAITTNGSDTTTDYGKATYGFFGGLVGANISSKVINSTIQNVKFVPGVADGVDGNYYVGGVAGYCKQIAPGKDLAVASGVYNNLVLNVAMDGHLSDDTNNADHRYTGNLVGSINKGTWAYNNLVIGVTNGFEKLNGSEKLWDEVDNDEYVYDLNNTPSDCAGHVLGGLDAYYLNGTVHRGGTCASGMNGVYCSSHQMVKDVESVEWNGVNRWFGSKENDLTADERMTKYNFSFATLTEFTNNFTTQAKYKLADENSTDTFAENVLMSNISEYELIGDATQKERGYLFYAALPIMKYEMGLTISENNSMEEEDKLLEAVYQFCRWTNDPKLEEYFGAKYDIVFKATGYTEENNQLGFPISDDAHFTSTGEDTLTEKRSYQQLIYAPEEPKCTGYTFLYWKLEGMEDWNEVQNLPDSDTRKTDLKYLDATKRGAYVFGRERVTKKRTFVAIWAIADYKVRYWFRDPEGKQPDRLLKVRGRESGDDYSIKVTFNQVIEKPENLTDAEGNVIDSEIGYKGYQPVGWYTEVPVNGIVANDDNKFINFDNMPAAEDGLDLYTGWKDCFESLRELVNDDTYKKYNQNYDKYFEDARGIAYHNAFETASNAISSEGNAHASEYLINLRNSYNNLRIDPKKIKYTKYSNDKSKCEYTAVFDEQSMENACPFLYDPIKYNNYITIKNTQIEPYVKQDPYENLTETGSALVVKYKEIIDQYIHQYDKINNAYNELKSNLKPSMRDENGSISTEAQSLIEKYNYLEAAREELYRSGEYEKYVMDPVESAREKAMAYWNDYTNDYSLKDIQVAVSKYENALKAENLKPNNGASSGAAEGDKKPGSAGMSPVIISIAVVAVLAALTYGYIALDVMKNKKRRLAMAKMNGSSAAAGEQNAKNDDEDTYI